MHADLRADSIHRHKAASETIISWPFEVAYSSCQRQGGILRADTH